MAPDNPQAREGLTLAEELRGRRSGRYYLRANLYYAVLLCLVAALAVATGVFARKAARANDRRLTMFMNAQASQQTQVQELAATLRAAVENADQRTAAEMGAFRQAVDVLSASLRQRQEGWQVASAQNAQSLVDLAQGLTVLKQSAAGQQSDLTGLRDSIEQQAAKLAQRVDEGFKSQAAQINTSSDTNREYAEKMFADVSRRLDALERESVPQIAQMLADLTAQQEGRVSVLRNDLSALGQALESSTATAQARLLEVSQRVEEAEASTRTILEATSAGICDELLAAESRQRQVDQALRADAFARLALKDDITELKTLTQKLGTRILGPSRAQVGTLQEKLDQLFARIDQVTAQHTQGLRQSP